MDLSVFEEISTTPKEMQHTLARLAGEEVFIDYLKQMEIRAYKKLKSQDITEYKRYKIIGEIAQIEHIMKDMIKCRKELSNDNNE